MHRFMKLDVWNLGMDLTVEVYHVTDKYPKQEMYGLTSQSRRSSVSIPSNIAEGAGRNNDGEFNLFLGYAAGSSAELITQLILAYRLNYITKEQCDALVDKCDHIMNKIYKLQSKLNLKGRKGGVGFRIAPDQPTNL
jgi:four helix bundle protein